MSSGTSLRCHCESSAKFRELSPPEVQANADAGAFLSPSTKDNNDGSHRRLRESRKTVTNLVAVWPWANVG